ncbi:MotE family protein [Halovulum sp. GXIMD14794]
MKTRARALPILAGCFLASGLLRLALVGPATAEVLFPPEVPDVLGLESACHPDSEVVLEALRERGKQLTALESELAERKAALEIAQAALDAKHAELVEAEARLRATISTADAAAEQDVAQLTAIYENVKPKRAAGIFASMDTDFAAGILARMSPSSAADILTLMDANQAYAISVVLAARNMNAGGPLPPTAN